jgi:hypothetical protein
MANDLLPSIPNFPGMKEPGTLDHEGEHKRMFAVDRDGQTVLIPGGDMDEEQAVAAYENSGDHLGVFTGADLAKMYSEQINRQVERQANGYISTIVPPIKPKAPKAGQPVVNKQQPKENSSAYESSNMGRVKQSDVTSYNQLNERGGYDNWAQVYSAQAKAAGNEPVPGHYYGLDPGINPYAGLKNPVYLTPEDAKMFGAQQTAAPVPTNTSNIQQAQNLEAMQKGDQV